MVINKFYCFVFLLVVMVPNIVWTMARNAPEPTVSTQNTLTLSNRDAAGEGAGDEKNVINYGGIGGFSGIGNNGLPFGGFGSGAGSLSNGIGGGFGAFTGFGPGGCLPATGFVPGGVP